MLPNMGLLTEMGKFPSAFSTFSNIPRTCCIFCSYGATASNIALRTAVCTADSACAFNFSASTCNCDGIFATCLKILAKSAAVGSNVAGHGMVISAIIHPMYLM